MLRCVNCTLFVKGMKRHATSKLPSQLRNILKDWLPLPQLPADSVLCLACFLILHEIGEDVRPSRRLGHLSVCIGCGSSVLIRRKEIVDENNPLLEVFPWHKNLGDLQKWVCYVCVRRGHRWLEKQGIPFVPRKKRIKTAEKSKKKPNTEENTVAETSVVDAPTNILNSVKISIPPLIKQNTGPSSGIPIVEFEMEESETKLHDVGAVQSENERSISTRPGSEYGKCVFCGASGKHTNMSEQVSDRRDYFDMLGECFNILLSKDARACSLICSACAGRLRDARDFRLLALRAQSTLKAAVEVAVGNSSSIRIDIKKEPQEPTESEEPVQAPMAGIEPSTVKMETDIDIVEHGLTRHPDTHNGVRVDIRTKENNNSGETAPKRQRLDNEKSSDGSSTTTLKIDEYFIKMADRTNKDLEAYAARPESVRKFLEAYYNGQNEKEDTSDYLSEIPDDIVVDIEKESKFLDDGCCCRQNCLEKFDRNVVLKSRLDFLEQDYQCCHNINHLYLLVLGVITATANDTSVDINTKRRTGYFWFRGVNVCKRFFQYVYGVSAKKYDTILRCFKGTGVEALTRGNKKSLTTKQTQEGVVSFIRRFSEQNSLVLPGRLLGTDLHILPNGVTRTSVYERYVRACKMVDKCPINRALWYKAWDNFCYNVIVGTTEHCSTCRDFCTELSIPQPDNMRMKCLKNAFDHLSHAQVQRAYYKNLIARIGTLTIDTGPKGAPMFIHKSPCSYEALVHYSFDYIQQIQLPHYNNQLGLIDFLDGYKVSLFGVAIEPLNKFVVYVIPEYIPACTNLVVSLLHHFFDTFGLGETSAVCHTVASKNRNNTIIQYALWRVMSGFHKSFQLSFLPSGHTKFAPDVYFGLFKSNFRESNAASLTDVCRIASSSDKNSSIIGLMVGNETGDSYVNIYDWNIFFTAHSLYTIELPSYYHFKTDSKKPGTVMCSKLSPHEYSEHVEVFGPSFGTDMPNTILPEPLSSERQKYLYTNVRNFVPIEYRDVLCPAPRGHDNSVPEGEEESLDISDPIDPKVTGDQDQDILVPIVKQEQVSVCVHGTSESMEQKYVCSYCGDKGHINEVKEGKFVCIKRQLASEPIDVENTKACESIVYDFKQT